MRWWCSSETVAWDWTWRPYVGVWLFILAMAIAYFLHLRRLDGSDRGRHAAFFSSGLLVLWAALDWPLGTLGASYLASVHVLQFLLIALVAPPLLLAGFPRASFTALQRRPRVWGLLEKVTQPLMAFFVFNVVMTVGHWPSVVDALMTSQLGSFALDIAWLAGGIVFWWPIVAPVPARPRFSFLPKIGYLALNGLLIRPPTLVMLYAKFPVYALYELAPPIPGTSAIDDQQLAGAVMKVGSAWIMMAGIAVLFYLWYRTVSREHGAGSGEPATHPLEGAGSRERATHPHPESGRGGARSLLPAHNKAAFFEHRLSDVRIDDKVRHD